MPPVPWRKWIRSGLMPSTLSKWCALWCSDLSGSQCCAAQWYAAERRCLTRFPDCQPGTRFTTFTPRHSPPAMPNARTRRAAGIVRQEALFAKLAPMKRRRMPDHAKPFRSHFIPFANWVNLLVRDWLVPNFRPFFRSIWPITQAQRPVCLFECHADAGLHPCTVIDCLAHSPTAALLFSP